MVLLKNIVLIGHLRHLLSSPELHHMQSLTHMVRPYQEVGDTSENRHKSMNARRAPLQALSKRRTSKRSVHDVTRMIGLGARALPSKQSLNIYFEQTCHKRSQSTSRPLVLFLVWDDPAGWSIISANIPNYIPFLVWEGLEQKQFF